MQAINDGKTAKTRKPEEKQGGERANNSLFPLHLKSEAPTFREPPYSSVRIFAPIPTSFFMALLALSL